MEPFEKRKRDPFMQEEYYEELDAFHRKNASNPDFPADRNLLTGNDDTHKRRKSFARASWLMESVWLRYSGGEPLERLRPEAAESFEDYRRHFEAFPQSKFKLWEIDAYYYVMLWLGWAVGFNLPQYIPLAASFIKIEDTEQDPLVSRLFEMLGRPGFPGRKDKLLHPKPYALLSEALDQDRQRQPAALAAYLRKWYNGHKGCYWYDYHKERLDLQLGYWAFETVMPVLLNDLDDAPLRKLNFYPKDLVDYNRQQGWDKELRRTFGLE
jgi:hypothetical protein